jgi:hypothetical protein
MQWFNYFCLINGTAMKKILFVSMLLMSFGFLQAQDYNTGIGLRGGPSSGLTVKHFLSDKAALEGILATRWGGWNITGLYEINKPLPQPRLNWYYGAGLHIGSWNGDRNPWFNDKENHIVLGADLILGIEYNFSELPLNVSLDIKPGFNVIGYKGLWGDEVALSLRYIF